MLCRWRRPAAHTVQPASSRAPNVMADSGSSLVEDSTPSTFITGVSGSSLGLGLGLGHGLARGEEPSRRPAGVAREPGTGIVKLATRGERERGKGCDRVLGRRVIEIKIY